MSKINKLMKTARGPEEIENWVFSLIPVLVAFSFYMVFILYSDIEYKHQLVAYGAAAGFSGLESYWIVRGWRNNHGMTVLMGIIGIAATMVTLYFYLSLIS